MHRSPAHSDHNCDSTIGLYGNTQGQHFHEILDNCHAAVKTIKIRHEIGNRINGIQLIYKFSNGHGQTVNGNMYGGAGGILSTINFDINNFERIVAVLGIMTHLALGDWYFSLAWQESMDLMEDVPEILSVHGAAKFEE